MTSISATDITLSLLSFALAAYGLRILVRHLRKIHLSICAKSWLHTQAKIKHSEIVRISQTQNWGEKVAVRYLYEVQGVTYEGNTIHPSYGRTELNAFHTWERLKHGRTLRVYYDPELPSRSTLTVGFHLASLLPVLAGLLAIVPAVGFAAWGCILLAGWQTNVEGLGVGW